MFGSWVTPLVGRHVVKHGLKFEGKFAIVKEKKIRGFCLLGSYPLVGRHVVFEPKVGCHVVNKSKVA
jgi:hypothetical protein